LVFYIYKADKFHYKDVFWQPFFYAKLFLFHSWVKLVFTSLSLVYSTRIFALILHPLLYFTCWYISLFFYEIRDNNINFLFHLTHYNHTCLFLYLDQVQTFSIVIQGLGNPKPFPRLISKNPFPSINLNFRSIHSYISFSLSIPPRVTRILPLRWLPHL